MSSAGDGLEPGPGGGYPGVDGDAVTAAADLPINGVAAALRRIAAVTIGQPVDETDCARDLCRHALAVGFRPEPPQ